METKQQRIYRCTRAMPYYHLQNPKDRGDTTRRQGYYIPADNKTEALKIMDQNFPADAAWGRRTGNEPFTVKFWENR